jgi:hypothetical protein
MKVDTQFDPDSIADVQLEPQTTPTHARAYMQRAVIAASQGNDVEMCEAFDNAARLDESYAESERDHVLASYRPAKRSVSEELANAILGHLHLPPLNKKDEAQTIKPPNPNDEATHDDTTANETAEVLREYFALFRDGKLPPEAFPLDTPVRAHAEIACTGVPDQPAP